MLAVCFVNVSFTASSSVTVKSLGCFTNLHHVVYGFDVGILQPERSQAENPGVMLLALLQTLDVILHSLTQEALPVCLETGERLHVQLQLFSHFYCVPA